MSQPAMVDGGSGSGSMRIWSRSDCCKAIASAGLTSHACRCALLGVGSTVMPSPPELALQQTPIQFKDKRTAMGAGNRGRRRGEIDDQVAHLHFCEGSAALGCPSAGRGDQQPL